MRFRANKDYPQDQRFFTFSDFETEMPFNNELCVVRMPGRVCVPAFMRESQTGVHGLHLRTCYCLQVLSDTIKFSREKSFLNPPVEYGGYFQIDDGMVFDDATREVTHVNYKVIRPTSFCLCLFQPIAMPLQPIEMDREYDVVAVLIHLHGIDNVEPLVEWAAKNPDRVPSDGIPCKHAVVSYFSRLIWHVFQ